MSIQIYNRANVNPGSPAAVRSGCTCAVHDNHHGEGIPDGTTRSWWMDTACPLHGEPESLIAANRRMEAEELADYPGGAQ